MKTALWVVAGLCAAACNKKAEPTKQEEPAPKAVEAKPAPAAEKKLLTITSKSPEAVKLFEQARELSYNGRGAETVEPMKKAIGLDPDFALAHAWLGANSPGAEGMAELDKAVALAAKLPEGERSSIEAMHLMREGKREQAKASFEKAAAAAPDDWHLTITLAEFANAGGDRKKAIDLLNKAVAAKPDLANAYNILAYAHAGLHEWDPAIAAAKKQVELLPKEPNPQDSLGEILLMSGKFEDADKAFQAAAALEPKFTQAWQGAACARAYRGDWNGARDAIAKQRAGAIDPEEKAYTAIDGAWIEAGDGKLPAALAMLDKLDADPEAKKLASYAFSAMTRGGLLQVAGKPADSLKPLADGLARADGLPGAGKNNATRLYAISVLRAAALTGKPSADTAKLVKQVEDLAAADPSDLHAPSNVAWAHGLVAWAAGKPKDAAVELAKCEPEAAICRYDLALVQRKNGDTAGAEATEKQLRETPLREIGQAYFVSKLPKK
jgi:tetratricopeptide (TPR) repeat protein